MDMAILKELGEWAAVGFYEGINLPWPRSYGLAYRRMYENMQVRIPEDSLLLPCEPFHNSLNMKTSKLWCAAGAIVDFDHNRGLRINGKFIEEKKKSFPQHAGFIDEFTNDLGNRLPHFGGYTHSNPDIRRIVNDGFLKMEAELDAELEAIKSLENGAPEELNLLEALKDYTCGIKTFHKNFCNVLDQAAEEPERKNRDKLKIIAAAARRGFLRPAENFLEGLFAVHFTWLLDGCDSIGRVDQALGALFEKDLDSGALDIEFARSLLDEWFQQFEDHNGWNLQVGGYTPEGKCGDNRLTEELILASERNTYLRPNVAFRVTQKTDDKLFVSALRAAAKGSGRPVFYNDELYIKTMMEADLGLTTEDAREIGFGGCTETMIAGMSNVGSLETHLNLPLCLIKTLYDGFDPLTGEQCGPHTGRFIDFKNFSEFMDALKRQIQYATDAFVSKNREDLKKRFTSGDPKLYRTFFTRDCVKNHKSFEGGGARYNWAVVSYDGVANIIDSVDAIRRAVFEEKIVSPLDLQKALLDDFAGQEPLRQRLLNLPKFGNNNPETDNLGQELMSFTWSELERNTTPRGGRYMPSVIIFSTYQASGMVVAATPDGRHAREVLCDSTGAAQGRDITGITALMKSVLTLPLTQAIGTPVLNLRLPKELMESEEILRKLVDVLRTYFVEGGLQVQFTIVSAEELLAAKKEPEKHRNLIVRLGGYSDYFCTLTPEMQDSIIARTEHAI